MPPRYAYWTILVDNRPTAFRAAIVASFVYHAAMREEKLPRKPLLED